METQSVWIDVARDGKGRGIKTRVVAFLNNHDHEETDMNTWSERAAAPSSAPAPIPAGHEKGRSK